MRKNWLAIAAVVALLLFGGAYFGSPYYALRNLKSAAKSGNADQIEAAVDFPAVRESLKPQLTAAMTKAMTDDPKIRNNPFAGLGMMLAPAIVDRAMDAFLTPSGIAALVKGRKPMAQASGSTAADPDIAVRSEWADLGHFRVRTRNTRNGDVGPSLLFERRGLFGWKLVRLELPDAMLKPGAI